MPSCWCLGTLRHAQVQHAQQSVPCLVWSSCQGCARIAAWLTFFFLRVRLVCPAFALLDGRTSCFRGGLHVEMTCFSVAVFAATSHGTSTTTRLVCVWRSIPCAPRTTSVTQESSARVRLRSVPSSAQGSVSGFKVMTVKSVEALMTTLTQQPLFSHHRSRQLSFQLYSDVVMQFWSNSNLDHEVLAVGYCTDAARIVGSVQDLLRNALRRNHR